AKDHQGITGAQVQHRFLIILLGKSAQRHASWLELFDHALCPAQKRMTMTGIGIAKSAPGNFEPGMKQRDEPPRALEVYRKRLLRQLQRSGRTILSRDRSQRRTNGRHQQRRGHPFAAYVSEREAQHAWRGLLPIVKITADLARGETARRELESFERRRVLRQQRCLHARCLRNLGLEHAAQFEILAAEAARAQQHLDSRRQLGLLDWDADEFVDDFRYPSQAGTDFVPRKREQEGKQHVALRALALPNR